MKYGRYWSIFILVFVSVAIVLYFNSHHHLLKALENITASTGIYLILLRLLFLTTNGLFLREFTLKFNIRLSLKEWFGLSAVTAMGNYITPFSGGLIARAAYLKYRHSFPYGQFTTLLASNYLVTFWVVGVVGIVASAKLVGSMQFSWELLLFIGVVIVISIMSVLPSVNLPGNNRISKGINTSIEGWHSIRNDKLLLGRLVGYTLFNILLNGLSFWVVYRALGLSISFSAALLISLVAVFTIMVNITPGNFGIQEAIISLSSEMVGAGAGTGLMVSLLIRAASLIPIFTLGTIFSFLLTRELTAHRADDKSEAV